MLQPRLHLFDSGKIAGRVGSIIIGADESVRDADVAGWIGAAADSFDLIWVQTQSRLEATLLDYRGTMVEMEGDRETVLSRSRLATLRYDVRALESDSDWREVERLLEFAAATRFSSDPHVSEATVRRHKLALMRSHVENRYGVVALSYTVERPAQLAGFQCTSLKKGSIDLYEIAVDPRFRQGFAATNLIRYNLERFALAHPEAERVVTRIYDNNVASLRFFERLGLSPTGRQLHYYHFWPTGSQ